MNPHMVGTRSYCQVHHKVGPMNSISIQFRIGSFLDEHCLPCRPPGLRHGVRRVTGACYKFRARPPGISFGVYVIVAAGVSEDYSLGVGGAFAFTKGAATSGGRVYQVIDNDLATVRDRVAGT